jgi:hypothetical protein
MQASHSQEAARGRMDAQVLTLPGNLSRNLAGGENLGTFPDARRPDPAVSDR